jgi:hypothetical protein
MVKRSVGLVIAALLCFVAEAAPQRSESRAPQLKERPELTRAAQPAAPAAPCAFRYAGRWFGNNRVVYELRQERDRCQDQERENHGDQDGNVQSERKGVVQGS